MVMCRAQDRKKIAKEYAFDVASEGDFSVLDAAFIAHLRAQIGDLKRTLAESRDLLIESKRLVRLAVEIKNPCIDPNQMQELGEDTHANQRIAHSSLSVAGSRD